MFSLLVTSVFGRKLWTSTRVYAADLGPPVGWIISRTINLKDFRSLACNGASFVGEIPSGKLELYLTESKKAIAGGREQKRRRGNGRECKENEKRRKRLLPNLDFSSTVCHLRLTCFYQRKLSLCRSQVCPFHSSPALSPLDLPLCRFSDHSLVKSLDECLARFSSFSLDVRKT